jgi:hypothetical protein
MPLTPENADAHENAHPRLQLCHIPVSVYAELLGQRKDGRPLAATRGSNVDVKMEGSGVTRDNGRRRPEVL